MPLTGGGATSITNTEDELLVQHAADAAKVRRLLILSSFPLPDDELWMTRVLVHFWLAGRHLVLSTTTAMLHEPATSKQAQATGLLTIIAFDLFHLFLGYCCYYCCCCLWWCSYLLAAKLTE
jgi:hypothetical protein